MNERAYQHALEMRARLASFPGASGISFHSSKEWSIFLVIVDDDSDVIALGNEMGLSLDIRREPGRWWRVAVGDREGGALRCEVSGPHHRGEAPTTNPE